jgi:hypothetical protein
VIENTDGNLLLLVDGIHVGFFSYGYPLLEAGSRKYPQMRDFALMAVESMVLFDNAERDLPPDLLVEIPWDTVKSFFIAQAKQAGRRWFWPVE